MSEKTLEFQKIYKQLSEPCSRFAIQRTFSEKTKKGYDTTGYGYQYCVNRLNEILGDRWGYTYKILDHSQGTYKSGAPYHEVTVEVSVWIITPENSRTMPGGHLALTFGDALKGAVTNAFKKAAAMWGVGKQAYEGSIDDDASYEEVEAPKSEPETNGHQPQGKMRLIKAIAKAKGIDDKLDTLASEFSDGKVGFVDELGDLSGFIEYLKGL